MVTYSSKTKAHKEKIIKLLDGTKTYKEIGKLVGMSHLTISKVAREHGLSGRGSGARGKVERNKKILNLLKKGKTYKFIGDKFGITEHRVYEIAKRNGLSGLKRGEDRAKRKEVTKEKILNLLKEGKKYREIRKALKTNTNLIAEVVRENGIRRNKNKMYEEE